MGIYKVIYSKVSNVKVKELARPKLGYNFSCGHR